MARGGLVIAAAPCLAAWALLRLMVLAIDLEHEQDPSAQIGLGLLEHDEGPAVTSDTRRARVIVDSLRSRKERAGLKTHFEQTLSALALPGTGCAGGTRPAENSAAYPHICARLGARKSLFEQALACLDQIAKRPCGAESAQYLPQ